MHGQYQLKSLINQRHEGTLREAQSRRLAKQARANRRPRFGGAVANSESSADSSLSRFMRVGRMRRSMSAKGVGKWSS
jgi:hypothetical protein